MAEINPQSDTWTRDYAYVPIDSYEVLMEIHRAACEVVAMWDRGLYLPSLDTKPIMERLVAAERKF